MLSKKSACHIRKRWDQFATGCKRNWCGFAGDLRRISRSLSLVAGSLASESARKQVAFDFWTCSKFRGDWPQPFSSWMVARGFVRPLYSVAWLIEVSTRRAMTYNGGTKVHDRSHNHTNTLMWSHDGSHIVVQHSQKFHDRSHNYTGIYQGRRSLQDSEQLRPI